MTVSKTIIEALTANGIDRVFCVPGESYLGLLDALYDCDDIDTVVCRHESGAGFMALADARMSGRPGIAMVSRGPGATNASIAVHTAQQDGVPFILFVGQVAARDVRRDAFQEIDYGQMFGSIAKWTAELTDPNRTAETILRALQVASSGVPGPVVIAIPEDVLTAECPPCPPIKTTRIASAPESDALTEVRAALAAAQKPLVIAGSGIDGLGVRQALLQFLEDWELPSVVTFRRQDLLPNQHRLYSGDMGLSNPKSQMDVINETDLILALGARLSDITTQGYTFPKLVRPHQRLIHIHADAATLGTHFACDIAIACSSSSFLKAIGKPGSPVPDRSSWISRLKAEQTAIAAVRSFQVNDGVPFELVVDAVGQALPNNAVVTVDAGTFGAPVYRVIPFRPPQRLLAPISGAMGFGVPAAVAAAIREPTRTVVCFVGDGGFLMTGSELAVALERKLPLKLILSENGIYGSIRIHQERDYPGRVSGTSFANPDLELMGRAYGCNVTRIKRVDQLSLIPALMCAPGPQFIVVSTSVEAILPKPLLRAAE